MQHNFSKTTFPHACLCVCVCVYVSLFSHPCLYVCVALYFLIDAAESTFNYICGRQDAPRLQARGGEAPT